jgi:hypothetical protein
MESLRKERNDLLLNDSRSSLTKIELSQKKDNSLTRTKFCTDRVELLFTSFITWIQEESKILSVQDRFTYTSTFFKDTENEKKNDKRISFDSLTPPTKNLILALGDVQLKKTLLFERSYHQLFEQVTMLGIQLLRCYEGSQKTFQSILDSVDEQSAVIEQNLCSEIRNSKEYLYFVCELDSIEADNSLRLNTTVTDTLHVDIEEKLLARCFRLLAALETSSSIHLQDEQNQENNEFVNKSQDVEARIALRVKKNELAKQKLHELSKTSASNVGILLERLRIAEDEIDDSIQSLNKTLSAKIPSSSFDHDKKHVIEKNDAHQNLLQRIHIARAYFKTAKIKIKVTKSSIIEEHYEETQNAKKDLAELVVKECKHTREQVHRLYSSITKNHEKELETILYSELTLRNELQNLLKLVRNDARIVDQCVRSLENIFISRLEKIERENFQKLVMFLETSSQVLVARKK